MIEKEKLLNILEKINNGEIEKALEQLNEIDENSICEKEFLKDLKLIKGAAYLQLNFLEEAQIEFEKALELDPKSSSACLGLGDIFYRSGLFKEAKTMFEYAIYFEPDNKSAQVALRKTNQKLSLPENDNSLITLQIQNEEINNISYDENVNTKSVLKKFENNLSEAYRLYQEKKYFQAYEKIIEAQKLFDEKEISLNKEDKASVYNLKGFILIGLQNIEAARSSFETALHLNPNSSQACAGLGEIFLSQNNIMQAKIMFEWAIENNPENEVAKNGLAKANKKLGYDDSHNTLNIDKQKLNMDSFYEIIGEAYKDFINNNFEKALEKALIAEKILLNIEEEQTLEISSIKNFIGFIYLNLKQFEKSQIQFESALNLNPSSSQACAGLAELFYLLEDYPKAKIMFEYAVKNNPLNKFAKQGLLKTNKKLNLNPEHNSLQ